MNLESSCLYNSEKLNVNKHDTLGKKIAVNYFERLGLQTCYAPIYWAPVYIDLFWKTLINYHDSYDAFWNEFIEGYVDRQDPRENPVVWFNKYKLCLNKIKNEAELLKPFHNLWPEFYDASHFEEDNNHVLYVNYDENLDLIHKIIEKLDESQDHVFRVNFLLKLANDIWEEIVASKVSILNHKLLL